MDELLLDDGEDPNLPMVSWGLICHDMPALWPFLVFSVLMAISGLLWSFHRFT